MHPNPTARARYEKSMLATSSPRAIEHEALARISAEIKRTHANRQAEFPAYVAALSKNLALWTQFAADSADPTNPLPESLRAAIIKIYAYVQRETLRLQRSHAEGGIEALLEINGNVCAGLRGKSAATGATCQVS